MARRKKNPAQSLTRFMHGIYDHYVDRGMPSKTAKARMIDHTFEEAVELMKKEEEVPDEMLVIMAQFMSRALNNRGAKMTSIIKKKEQDENFNSEPYIQPLRDIKQVKDAVDTFIETYKGWSEIDEQD